MTSRGRFPLTRLLTIGFIRCLRIQSELMVARAATLMVFPVVKMMRFVMNPLLARTFVLVRRIFRRNSSKCSNRSQTSRGTTLNNCPKSRVIQIVFLRKIVQENCSESEGPLVKAGKSGAIDVPGPPLSGPPRRLTVFYCFTRSTLRFLFSR